MHEFEKFLIDNGYVACRVEGKGDTARLVKIDVWDMSTIGGKDNCYIYVPMSCKHHIALMNGKFIPHSKFKPEDFNSMVTFGFDEPNKPATLLQPRPNIKLKQYYDCFGLKIQTVLFQDNQDAMIYILETRGPKEVFDAIWNRETILS